MPQTIAPIWRVPMIDPARTYAPMEGQLTDTFRRVLQSGRYILGPEVVNFEQEMCAFLDVEHCIGMSSGTDALLATLLALNIGAGDEVITSPMTFVATAEAILRAGATPVFVDICPNCLCLDPNAVSKAIGDRTKAVLTVSLFGQLGHTEELSALTNDTRIALVEDACQSFGARLGGKTAGTLGRAGCFSFFPTKTLGGFGDAGLVSTRDSELASRVRALRTHGCTNKNRYGTLGGNFRIDALHAALLSTLLPHLGGWLIARNSQACTYTQSLGDIPLIRTPSICGGGTSAWSVYTIRVLDHRDTLKEYLAKRGIETAVYYPTPLAQQPLFSLNARVCDSLAVAKAACREVLSLPVFPGLAQCDQQYVIRTIREFFDAETNHSRYVNSSTSPVGTTPAPPVEDIIRS